MDHVYVVTHTWDDANGCEEAKLIGVFRTEEKANEAVERSRSLPGFCERPEDFFVDRYELDRIHWETGFVTVYPGD